jgi:hypothetical protein
LKRPWPFPVWRTRSGMTSRLRWRTQMVTDGAAGAPGQPASGPDQPPQRQSGWPEGRWPTRWA